MKKILSLMFTLLIILGLSACSFGSKTSSFLTEPFSSSLITSTTQNPPTTSSPEKDITSSTILPTIESDINWTAIDYYKNIAYSYDQITELAHLLRDTVNYVTYGDARYVYVEDTSNPTYQYILYDTTGKNIPLDWGDGGVIKLADNTTYSVDREHIWACNNMRIMPPSGTNVKVYTGYVLNTGSMNYRPSNTSKGHFSDLHNLWNATRSTNQNLHSDNFFGGSTLDWNDDILDVPSTNNGIFYPGEEYCGDVARACFYMTLMYPYLTLVNSDSKETEGSIYYGYLDVLLEWNELDPVSEEEIQRNNSIYLKQKNRNPFIDFYSSNIADFIFSNGDPEIGD